MNKPQPGDKYKHFKGNIYQILCVGKDSETEEEKVVYQDTENPEKIWIRPLGMFLDMKELPDGLSVERFTKID